MTNNPIRTVALTGATGFLGGRLLPALMAEGYKVRALTRKNRDDETGIRWIEGTLEDPAALQSLIKGADVIIHAAGVVKALTRDDFFFTNRDGTKRLARIAKEAGTNHFLHISSLVAREPRLSHYAASKAAAEQILTSGQGPTNWSILRPPAIYGPGDFEFLPIIKMAQKGLMLAPGSRKNRFSMIHVTDLVAAIVGFIKAPQTGLIAELDDGAENGYNSQEFAAALEPAFGKTARTIGIPAPFIRLAGALNGVSASISGKADIFTASKANELLHANWVIDPKLNTPPKGWTPTINLTTGMTETIEWYRQQGIL